MPKIESQNIFSRLPAAKKRESFQVLRRGRGFKIERIVSCGQATPAGRWLCSKTAEWVMVLKGRARLSFQGTPEKINMKAGDHAFIPANTFHRVDWTLPKQKTVWLAVHLG